MCLCVCLEMCEPISVLGTSWQFSGETSKHIDTSDIIRKCFRVPVDFRSDGNIDF